MMFKYGVIKCLKLQYNLEKLFEWSEVCQSLINATKCIMMHIGHQSTDKYTVNNIELPVVQTYNDSGVMVSKDLETTGHCRAVATKGPRSLWSVCRAYNHVDAKTSVTLYAVFFRPELE